MQIQYFHKSVTIYSKQHGAGGEPGTIRDGQLLGQPWRNKQTKLFLVYVDDALNARHHAPTPHSNEQKLNFDEHCGAAEADN